MLSEIPILTSFVFFYKSLFFTVLLTWFVAVTDRYCLNTCQCVNYIPAHKNYNNYTAWCNNYSAWGHGSDRTITQHKTLTPSLNRIYYNPSTRTWISVLPKIYRILIFYKKPKTILYSNSLLDQVPFKIRK